MAKQHLQSVGKVLESEDISAKAAEKDDSIKLRAYQIHEEKGGSDLDNWLEAERSLKDDIRRR